MSGLRDTYLGQAWLVLILSLVFGGALAGVQVAVEDRIEANVRAETLSRIPGLVLGETLGSDPRVVLAEHGLEVLKADGTQVAMQVSEMQVSGHQVFEVLQGDEQTRVGWVVRGAGPGYADRIEILIGLRPDGREISGLWVLSQRETPALGDAITGQAFRGRFVGAPTERSLEVTKTVQTAETDPSKILALTAATISSQSVCEIVNRTVADIRRELTGLE